MMGTDNQHTPMAGSAIELNVERSAGYQKTFTLL